MYGPRPLLHRLAVLLLGVVLSACSRPEFGDSEAGLALEDLVTGPTTSRLEARTAQPVREAIRIRSRDRELAADLYRPPQGARAGIILVTGVAARGRRDARVVAVAGTLTRLGFTVLVPDMPGVRRYRMRAGDVRSVADCFAWLDARPQLAPPGHVGIAGFSYAAGPALLAALEPEIREQVNFVLTVGGYYSVERVVTYLTTGYYQGAGPAGGTSPAMAGRHTPHPYAVATFIRSNLDFLERPADRAFMRRYADYISGSHYVEDEPRPPALASDARAFYELLDNHLPGQVPALLQRLPARMRRELEGVDPAAHDLGRLQASVILLHGRGDTLIPYTESIALAHALPAGQAQLFLVDGLAHVDFRPEPHDVPQLLGLMEALLARRAPMEDE